MNRGGVVRHLNSPNCLFGGFSRFCFRHLKRENVPPGVSLGLLRWAELREVVSRRERALTEGFT